jgi:hypothetical protein
VGVNRADSQLAVSPVSLNFGNVPLGSNVTLPVTVISTGMTPVMIGLPTISGSAGFTVSGTPFPFQLRPRQRATLFVTFTPTSLSQASGVILISSSAMRQSGVAVTLTSQGINPTDPGLGVSHASLSFGTVDDTSSVTLPVTLTSTGTTALTINSAQISGKGFSVSGGAFPMNLDPSLGITLNVKFTPTAGIPMNGALTISSNSSGGAATVVKLNGNGQYVVNLTWDAPSSSPALVTGYNIYRAPGISSPSYQLLNSSPNSQTAYSDSTVQPNTTYNYFVKSVNRDNVESAPSGLVTVTIPLGSGSQ